MTMASITLGDWKELHDLARHGWLYRGQRSAGSPLQTSLERCCDRGRIDLARRSHIESEFIREFRRSYHQYEPQQPLPGSPLEWLSIMQHHGAPTRLLDFTYSIYIAAYFAIENADDDCAIWAVNGPWALRQSHELLLATEKDQSDIDRILELFTEEDEAVIRRLFFEPPFATLACPINPFRLNERLRVQKGVFLAPGTVQATFMENLQTLAGCDDSDNLIKIIVPVTMRHEGIRLLNAMNVNSTSLFPGLDGFARSLAIYHTSFNPVKWQ